MPRFRNLTPTSDEGACLDHDELFYSAEDEPKGQRRRKEQEAKAICETCAVLETCRQFAMDQGELYGVWGGLTESERHKLAGRHRTG